VLEPAGCNGTINFPEWGRVASPRVGLQPAPPSMLWYLQCRKRAEKRSEVLHALYCWRGVRRAPAAGAGAGLLEQWAVCRA